MRARIERSPLRAGSKRHLFAASRAAAAKGSAPSVTRASDTVPSGSTTISTMTVASPVACSG